MKLTINDKEFEFEEPKEAELNLSHMEEILGLYYGYYQRLQDAEARADDSSLDDILLCSRMMTQCDNRLRSILLEWQPDLDEQLNGTVMNTAIDLFNLLSGGEDTVKNSSSAS